MSDDALPYLILFIAVGLYDLDGSFGRILGCFDSDEHGAKIQIKWDKTNYIYLLGTTNQI